MTERSPQDSRTSSTVFVVDDDAAMRRGMMFLLHSAGLRAVDFDSAEAFLEVCLPGTRGCLLLDLRMPGMSGLEAQEELLARGVSMPMILVTAYADVPIAVRAMRAGAFDFVEKPFDDEYLLKRVQQALAIERDGYFERARLDVVNANLSRLTPRERQVLELVLDGLLNKQIAHLLGISIKTVEEHRARLMEKMQADCLADLVRMATLAGLD